MTEFIDAESGFNSGSGDDDFSFRITIMTHLRKICNLASVEFRGGHYENKTSMMPNGLTIKEKVYVPDTREQYSNAVDALHDLLMQNLIIYNRKKQKIRYFTECEQIYIEIEQLRQRFLNRTEKDDKEVLTSGSYEGNDKLLLEEYKFANLRLHRKLFQKLCCFLKEINYLQTMAITD